MDAAAKLLEIYPEESFKPQLKIIIPYQGTLTEDPDPDNTNQQSRENHSQYKPRPWPTSNGPSYIEKTLEDLPLSEIIKIAASTPEHLLPVCTICNFPMVYPCSINPAPTYTDPSTLPCVKRHTSTGETVH
jgi:hypothetical protein